MSDQTNNSITAKLLTGLRTRIENKEIEAKARYRDGDREWFAHNREVAGKHYRAALIIYAQVTDLRTQADELREEWQVDEEEIDVLTRWQVVPKLTHRGVGEGDSGLDEDEEAEHANIEDARRAAIRPHDVSESIPPEVLATYYGTNPPLVPCCDPCREPDCEIDEHGQCAQIRRFLSREGPPRTAEWKASNPSLPGFVGDINTACS